jgi:hypothetical protein
MRFLLGGIVVAFMLALAVGALTGRVKARNCCSASARTGPSADDRSTPAGPEMDPRLDAFIAQHADATKAPEHRGDSTGGIGTPQP